MGASDRGGSSTDRPVRSLYLCGAGNLEGIRLALRVNEAEARWDRIVLLDDDPALHGTRLVGVEVSGAFELLARACEEDGAEVVNLVARTSVKRRAARRRIDEVSRGRARFASLVSPEVDRLGVNLGRDVSVYPGAFLGAGSTLGGGSVVFTAACFGHGSTASDGCIIGPHAVVNARVCLGEGCYVGSGAVVLPDLEIGEWATVAAGSVVMHDVPRGATVMGSPAEVRLTLEQKRKLPGALPADLAEGRLRRA